MVIIFAILIITLVFALGSYLIENLDTDSDITDDEILNKGTSSDTTTSLLVSQSYDTGSNHDTGSHCDTGSSFDGGSSFGGGDCGGF